MIKCLLAILIIIAASIYYDICSDTKISYTSDDSLINAIPDAKPAKPKGQMKITFINGDTITVIHNVFTDEQIDSVVIISKSFKAFFDNCHKGRLNLDLFLPVKCSDTSRYNGLKRITTAYTFYDENDYKIGANGMDSKYCGISRGCKVIVNSSIYYLFRKRMNLYKILIIDSIKINH